MIHGGGSVRCRGPRPVGAERGPGTGAVDRVQRRVAASPSRYASRSGGARSSWPGSRVITSAGTSATRAVGVGARRARASASAGTARASSVPRPRSRRRPSRAASRRAPSAGAPNRVACPAAVVDVDVDGVHRRRPRVVQTPHPTTRASGPKCPATQSSVGRGGLAAQLGRNLHRGGNLLGRTMVHLDGIRPREEVRLMFLRRDKAHLPTADEALPGRPTPSVRRPRAPLRARHAARAAVPRGLEQIVFGMGCFWGAERKFWKAPGVYTTAVGYAGGFTPEPHLRRGVLGPHRSHRGRARRVRPEGDVGRRDAAHVLGEPRPDAGHAPGQRRRHAVPLERLHVRRRAGGGRRGVAADVPGAARRRRATARSRPRSRRAGTFFYAEDYHQQYLARTRTATAASAARA